MGSLLGPRHTDLGLARMHWPLRKNARAATDRTLLQFIGVQLCTVYACDNLEACTPVMACSQNIGYSVI